MSLAGQEDKRVLIAGLVTSSFMGPDPGAMASDTAHRRDPNLPATADTARSVRRRLELLAGGTDGNERLTVATGVLLIVLLAPLGVTIVFIGRLLWWHLFLGLVLIGPVALKLASTGYRFARYYAAEPRYRGKGPPPPVLRTLGPVLVGLTTIVFATGIVLLVLGPSSRGTVLLIHKVSFICWAVVTAIHIAGHLPELARGCR
jgi:hypothetical protein